MDLKELYETNADFRGYVDRYTKHNGITVEEALTHATVRLKAEDLQEGEQNESITNIV